MARLMGSETVTITRETKHFEAWSGKKEIIDGGKGRKFAEGGRREERH